MEQLEPHRINLTRLQISARHMMAMCGWKNSIYWSSTSTNPKNIPTRIVVRVAYFENLNWVGFNFCKYHPDAVNVIRNFSTDKRFFHQITINRYTSFKVWCIDGQHFDFVVAQLQQYADIKLEFVVSHQDRGLVIPEPFTQLGLTFYQRGNRC